MVFPKVLVPTIIRRRALGGRAEVALSLRCWLTRLVTVWTSTGSGSGAALIALARSVQDLSPLVKMRASPG
jgi:hypothetical protein